MTSLYQSHAHSVIHAYAMCYCSMISSWVKTPQLATRMSLSKSFGRIDPFKPENETIAAYLERVDLYFLANDIPDAKKVAILLTSVGDRIYALLRDYFTPNKPADQTYAAIEKALKEHYEPPKIVIAERFHFYQRSQAEGETIAALSCRSSHPLVILETFWSTPYVTD